MNSLPKIIKGVSILAVFGSSLWVAGLAYLAKDFTKNSIQKIEAQEISVTLATGVVAYNWYVLIVLSLLYLVTALLLWKRKINSILCVVIALSFVISTLALNTMVVSSGFELQ
ncbi:hypothetical protein NBRC116583_07990 [Arenicella sp. 4NH20-0111]|uniref:hypothetical protein n=1 Tax=Arenicella sp. 4NH20-0111 TaxID=3127648 RepID=UPI003105D214